MVKIRASSMWLIEPIEREMEKKYIFMKLHLKRHAPVEAAKKKEPNAIWWRSFGLCSAIIKTTIIIITP